MVISSFKKLFFVSAVLVILVLAACQKEIDIDDPDIIPVEVKDSTLLVKSIVLLIDNGQDSIVEHYSYDSVNRKILVTWDDTFENYAVDGSSADFAYNNQGLLSEIIYKYPAGYVPAENDYDIINIVYDAQNVLQKITTRLGDGSIETIQFNKTLLSSGNYQLSWIETDPFLPNDSFPRKAVFNAAGKNIINIIEHLFVSDTTPTGGNIFANAIIKDSLIYDASGSVSKIFTNITDTIRGINEDYISYDFSIRQTKGDQLYNQRQLIMNGIANMPFGNSDLGSFIADEAFGILSINLETEYQQYAKYPIQKAKVYMWDNSIREFTAHSEFDNKNRLTKFTGFLNDYDLEPIGYRISYYK